ncbi:MAG TPA: ATP-binding protein [Gaiellaceae bacterium]|nr:ATP-binding protein [Gaiellaceae bacterium]
MRWRLGIRWWLGAAFALIAAVTAAAVALVFSQQSAAEFRDRAEDVAAGRAVSAAIDVAGSEASRPLGPQVAAIADRHRVALFVFDDRGRLLTPGRSRGVVFTRIDKGAQALREALGERRFVETNEEVEATVLGLPVYGGNRRALVAYASHPDLAAGLGIVRNNVVGAMLWAILLGGVTGFVVATLISLRLRRIAATAGAIEAGQFDQPLNVRFPDEVGALGATIERMRKRLRASFAQLEAERDRLEQLLERLHEGVLLLDPELRIVVANPQAARIMEVEFSEGDALPDPWPTVSLRRLAASLFEDGAEPTEVRFGADEETVYLVVGLPPADHDNALLVITDVSERERRERAEREFVTNAAHELRTPLTTITGAVELLQSGAKEIPEERDRFLEHIERDSKRLVRLARALLILARAQTTEEAPRLQGVELRPLLEEIAASLVPAAGVEVEVDCPSGLTVLTEPALAEQALANAAANAVKHTAQGTVRLRAWEAQEGEVVVEIRDTGSGMSGAVKRRIFDRFYRGDSRDGEGFGLGMAIVNESVRAVGGSIRVDSVPGVGTTVRISLPASSVRAA